MLQVHLASSAKRISEQTEQHYLTGIPAAMHAAIQRYRHWEDRQATLFGKLLLQRALRSRLGQGESWSLERLEHTEKGKPFIRGAPGFNISHSGGVVALAMVDTGEVGIDVEKIRAVDLADFANYLPETAGLVSLDPSERLNSFFACWTKKEAVLKGEGSGLLAPLEEVHLGREAAVFRQRPWGLRKIDCGAAYCCHVATSEHQAGCLVETVNF